MIKSIKKRIALIIKNNIKGYILISAIFVAGIVLGIILNSSSVREEEIRVYFSDYIMGIKNSGTDSLDTFNLSMAGNIKFATVMFLLSVTIIGMPIALIYIFMKGFSLGTVICCLFKAFGGKALLVIFCSIVPHGMLAFPCFIAYSMYCIKNAGGLLSGGTGIRKNIFMPFAFGILFLCLVSISALIQAYVEPILIKLISSYLIN